MTKQNIVIVGAGGFARELHEMLWDVYSPEVYQFKGFLGQADAPLEPFGFAGSLLLDDPESYQPADDDRFLLAIGHMAVRRKIVETLAAKQGEFLSFVHPQARIASTARLGQGVVIYPFAVVSNQSHVEPFVHLNYFASVGHDCQVGEYSLLAPYATLNGFVTLEAEAYISTHATVAPGKRVGQRSKISANSACMQDAAADSIVFGVPGRQVRRL